MIDKRLREILEDTHYNTWDEKCLAKAISQIKAFIKANKPSVQEIEEILGRTYDDEGNNLSDKEYAQAIIKEVDE